MIGYLEGSILKIDADRVLLLVNGIGFEILLPAFIMEGVKSKEKGDAISLFIYYQQTERQPKPVLIGFNLEAEKEFFEHFISVEDIGPLKAVRALQIPIRDIARAIEARDAATLKRLKGIGERTAQKIIANLCGKMEKFAMIRKAETVEPSAIGDFTTPVLEVLVNQLGYKRGEAVKMISEALERSPSIATPEQLFEEVYRGETER